MTGNLLGEESKATRHRKTAEKKPQKAVHLSQDTIEGFIHGLETLPPTERIIYSAYLDVKSSKEVMSELSIKENTLKFHNKNLYSKLGITSRKQLLSIAAQLKKDSASTNR